MARKTARTKHDAEIEGLRAQLAEALQSRDEALRAQAEAEETLRSLRQGEADRQARAGTQMDQRTEVLERSNRALREEAERRAAAQEDLTALLEETRQQNDELTRSRAEIASQAQYPEENPNPVMRLDLEGVLLYANHASAELMTAWDWTRSQAAPPFLRDLLAQAQASGEDQVIDVTCGKRVYELHLALVPNADYVNIYGRDVTSRNQAEQALRQARDELEATFVSMAEAAMVYDTAGRVVRANRSAVSHLGFDPVHEEMANLPDRLSSRHPDGRPLALSEAPSARALRGETVMGQRFVLTLAGGASRTVVTSAAPLVTAGQVSGAVVVWHDVTEEEQAKAQLEESKRLLDALMDSVPEGITIADAPDIRIRMVSRYGQELLGGPHAGKTVEQVAAEWQLFSPDGVTPMPTADSPLARAVQKGETVRDLELVQVNAYGQSLPLLCNAAPIRDGQGAIIGGVVAWRDITDRKQAEEALRLSEEKFALAFANNAAAIALTRLEDGLFLDVNETWEALNGYRREEVIGVSARDLPIWPTAEAAARFVGELREKGTLRGWEQEFQKKSGEAFVAELSAQVLTIRGEKVILSTLVDITERKSAEAALQARENELRLVINSVPAAISYQDRDFRYRRVNETYRRWFGVVPQEVEGRHVWEVVGEAAWELARSRLERAMAGETVTYEEYMPYRAGGARWVTATLMPNRDAEGEVQGLVALVTDITERKQAEVQLAHAFVEAQERAAETEAIFASINDAVLIYDLEMNVAKANPAFIAAYGFNPTGLNVREVIQRVDCRWLDGRPLRLGDQPTPRALRGEKTSGARYLIRPPGAGADKMVETASAPLHADGKVIGSVTVWHDITERERLLSQVQEAAEALQTANEALAQQAEELRAQNEELELTGKDLRESEERYHALFNGMTEGFALHEIICDTGGVPCDYVFLDVNPAFERLTGLKRADVVGKANSQIAGLQGDDPKWIEIYGQVALCGESVHFEHYSPALKRWDEVYAFCPTRGQFAIIFLDITLRKQVEDELRQARDKLEVRVHERTLALEEANAILEEEVEERRQAENLVRQNAERLTAVADTSRALVEAGFDDQAMLDRAASMMAGLIGEICVIRLLSEDGDRLALASYHHADPAQQAALDRVMASDPPDAPEDLWRTIFETREPIFRPAASVEDLRRFTRLAALRLPGQRGSLIVVPLTRQSNVSGAVTLFRSSAQCPYTLEDVKLVQSLADLTALAVTNAHLHRDLEASLALETSTRQQLVQAEKLSALGRMVGSVAHELNNPLQTITNCLYLTDQELTPHSPIHDYLEMAQAETQRLVDLVAQLRELYRMRPTGASEARRLDSLLHDVQTLMAPQLTSANVEWLQPANVPDCVVNVIQDRLKQVFINLAGNAIEAMQPRGGQLRIDVTPTADGRQVAVTFKDSGPGILPENLGRLFEPFFTTKAQGLGLGLSICYEIVQQHGGQITVESQPEQGAAFTVWLPLAAQDEKPEFASQ